MAYPTFAPKECPDSAMDRAYNPRMRENQFDDGYEQVAPIGLHNNLEELSPKWTNAPRLQGEYIKNFFHDRAGRPFLWRVNNQGPLRCYRTTSYNVKQKKGDYYDISATLKEMAMT